MQNGGGEKSRAQEKEGTQIFDRFSNFINKCFQKGGDLLWLQRNTLSANWRVIHSFAMILLLLNSSWKIWHPSMNFRQDDLIKTLTFSHPTESPVQESRISDKTAAIALSYHTIGLEQTRDTRLRIASQLEVY